MRSKYDSYWAGRLEDIRLAVELALAGSAATVGVPGLQRLGNRQSWSGVAEVRGCELTRSSGAHARSLGNAIAASGICSPWEEVTFRLVIGSAGVVVVVTRADGGQPRPHRSAVGQGRPAARLKAASPVAVGTVPRRPKRAESSAGAAAPGDRQRHTAEFYCLLDELAERIGRPLRLRDCTGYERWPECGMYFFYEDGEGRADGSGRVVRVGTHALKDSDLTRLWGRLAQHRGQLAGRHPGGGNHRASVFRRHVGSALIRHGDRIDQDLLSSWLDRRRDPGERSAREAEIELEASRYIGAMPFVWLNVPGRPDLSTGRAYLERNSIALLSCRAGGLDQPSAGWLGHFADNVKVSESGLWNVHYVDRAYDPGFLSILTQLVRRTHPGAMSLGR